MGKTSEYFLFIYQKVKLKHCIQGFFFSFTCLGEKKEVTDPGIRSYPPNIGVAQLYQVMD